MSELEPSLVTVNSRPIRRRTFVAGAAAIGTAGRASGTKIVTTGNADGFGFAHVEQSEDAISTICRRTELDAGVDADRLPGRNGFRR